MYITLTATTSLHSRDCYFFFFLSAHATMQFVSHESISTRGKKACNGLLTPPKGANFAEVNVLLVVWDLKYTLVEEYILLLHCYFLLNFRYSEKATKF